MRIHNEFAARIDELGYSNISAEVSYINEFPTGWGMPGSSRADAVVGSLIAPEFAVDLKMGPTPMSQGQYDRCKKNLPKGTKLYSLHIVPKYELQ